MSPEVSIFDPRLRQEFEIENAMTKTRFSNLDENFLVLTGVEFDWPSRSQLVAEGLLRNGGLGFLVVTPWVPHTAGLEESFRENFSNWRSERGALLAYFTPSEDRVKRIFELRYENGADASGEWSLGCCRSEFSPPDRRRFGRSSSWGFAHILTQSPNILFALDLAEMKQSTLLTRLFGGVDEWTQRVLSEPDASDSAK